VRDQWPVTCYRSGWERPTDFDALNKTLDKESERTLFDWFSVLRGMPIILFDTPEPPWWDEIMCQFLKRQDLEDTIYERLRKSEDIHIIPALEIFHGL